MPRYVEGGQLIEIPPAPLPGRAALVERLASGAELGAQGAD
jgi:hypothetical protein